MRASIGLRSISSREVQFLNQLAQGGWLEPNEYRMPQINIVRRNTITVKEAAQRLWCTEQTVSSLVDQRELGGLVFAAVKFVDERGIERLARNPHFIRCLRRGGIARQRGV